MADEALMFSSQRLFTGKSETITSDSTSYILIEFPLPTLTSGWQLQCWQKVVRENDRKDKKFGLLLRPESYIYSTENCEKVDVVCNGTPKRNTDETNEVFKLTKVFNYIKKAWIVSVLWNSSSFQWSHYSFLNLFIFEWLCKNFIQPMNVERDKSWSWLPFLYFFSISIVHDLKISRRLNLLTHLFPPMYQLEFA